MREPRRRLRLSPEAGGELSLLGVPAKGGVHDLDRDETFETRVESKVDRCHATRRNAFAHLVAAVDETAQHGVGQSFGHGPIIGSRLEGIVEVLVVCDLLETRH